MIILTTSENIKVKKQVGIDFLQDFNLFYLATGFLLSKPLIHNEGLLLDNFELI
jgi:hypothetical protein